MIRSQRPESTTIRVNSLSEGIRLPMDARVRFQLMFVGICVVAALLLSVTGLGTVSFPTLRWAIPLVWIAAFIAAYWLFRHYRNRLPRPTQRQQLKAAKRVRRLAWIYFGGLVFGSIVNWKMMTDSPYGAGFLILLIPIFLGAYYLRLSIKLKRSAENSDSSGAATP